MRCRDSLAVVEDFDYGGHFFLDGDTRCADGDVGSVGKSHAFEDSHLVVGERSAERDFAVCVSCGAPEFVSVLVFVDGLRSGLSAFVEGENREQFAVGGVVADFGGLFFSFFDGVSGEVGFPCGPGDGAHVAEELC